MDHLAYIFIKVTKPKQFVENLIISDHKFRYKTVVRYDLCHCSCMSLTPFHVLQQYEKTVYTKLPTNV